MRTAFLIVALVLLLAGTAGATTYYVRTDGNDANLGTSDSASGAFLTIDKGVYSLVDGDTLWINGTYQVAANTTGTKDGFSLKYGYLLNVSNISIIGVNATLNSSQSNMRGTFLSYDTNNNTIKDIIFITNTSSGTETVSACGVYGFPALMANVSTIHGLNLTQWTLQNLTITARYGYGIVIRNVSDTLIKNVTIRSKTPLYLGAASACGARNERNVIDNVNISINTGYGSGGIGIDINGYGYNTTIKNSKIFGMANDGVRIYSGSDYSVIENNTINNNTNWGISVTSSEHSIIRNNTIYWNRDAGIRIVTESGKTKINNTIKNNIIWGTTGAYAPRPGAGIWITDDTDAGTNKVNHSDLKIESNVIYNNSIGISINNNTKGVNNIFRNNIISNNTKYGVQNLNSSFSANITYSDVFNNFISDITANVTGNNNISSDPLFVDTVLPSSDFHLQSTLNRWNGVAWVQDAVTSPAIGAGDPTSDNSLSPWGGTIEMGAYGNTAEASQGATTSPSISYSINLSNVSKTISDHLIGTNLNIDTGELAIYNTQNWTNAAFRQNAIDMGIKVVRFPGGEWADTLRWTRDTSKTFADDPDGAGKLVGYLTPKYIDDFIAFTTAIGAEPLITVNVYDNNVSAATDLINYTIEKGYDVKYWEIGNEVYTVAGEYPTYSDFAPVWFSYYTSMKRAKPTIQFIGWDGWYDSYDWGTGADRTYLGYTNQFLANYSRNISYVDMHIYPRSGNTLFDSYLRVYNGVYEDSAPADVTLWNQWINKTIPYTIAGITHGLLVLEDKSSGMSADASYNGTDYFYVDNITLINSVTGDTLLIAGFETGTDGVFSMAGDDTVSLESVSDVALQGSKSLKVTYNFTNTDGLSLSYLSLANPSFAGYDKMNVSIYIPSQTDSEKEFLAGHYKELPGHFSELQTNISGSPNPGLRMWSGEEDLVSSGDATNHGWGRSMISPMYISLAFSEYINYSFFSVQNWLIGYEAGALQYHNGAMETEKTKYVWEMLSTLKGSSLNITQNSTEKVNLIPTIDSNGTINILASNYNALSNKTISVNVTGNLTDSNVTVHVLNDTNNDALLLNITVVNGAFNYTLSNYSIYIFRLYSDVTGAPAVTAGSLSVSCPVGWCYLAMNYSSRTLAELDAAYDSDLVEGYYDNVLQRNVVHRAGIRPNRNAVVYQKSGYYYYFRTPTVVSMNLSVNPSVTLAAGWNLVGNMAAARTLADLRTDIGSKAILTRHFNNSLQSWESADAETVNPGESFFVYMTGSQAWGG